MHKIYIFDSTLRDGAQSEGINFSVEDKLAIVASLDEFGVEYIEAGNPGSNPKDIEFFTKSAGLKLKHAKLVAFGSTRRKDIAAADDKNVQSLLEASTPAVAIFGKCWDLHVKHVINTTPEENLLMIEDTVAFLVRAGKEVIFDAEHFFDGYKANPEYAVSALKAAEKGGASTLCLCDTNGGAFPSEVAAIISKIKPEIKVSLGIHCHNDGGMAVACSIAAVEAGVNHVQGTFIGFGERTGNANLSTIIPNLQLKKGYDCIPNESLENLTATAEQIAEISNLALEAFMPYVGQSAFTHKAGMHADGVMKLAESFEHINPEKVGNSRRFLMSEIAGRTVIASKLTKHFPFLTKDSPEIIKISARIKELEHGGYQFEGAEASLILEVYKILGLYKPYFELISFNTTTTLPGTDITAKAIVKIKVNDKTELTCAEGNGPVNALDKAIRKNLEVFYPALRKVKLTDYKVRVLDSKQTSGSKVRVLISNSDGDKSWTTVGVSTDIIEASFKALSDSIEYMLMLNDKTIKLK